MKLRGIDFGPISDASGLESFFGEGYAHHRLLKLLGLNLNGCGFTTKTTTLSKNLGWMPMKENGITPREFLPKCIMPNFRPGNIALSLKMFREGIMLNAVGLSGPGAEALFEDGRWQKRTSPFWISFMSVARTPTERIIETKIFVDMFRHYLRKFKTKVGLKQNFSCPNIGLNPGELVSEVIPCLEAASVLSIPLMPKFNILAPIWPVKEICASPHCDAICVSNAIPWNDLQEVGIDPVGLFGTSVSPLADFGNGGGLSGKPLLPLVAAWVCKARLAGIEKPINAGGGILSVRNVEYLKLMGASSVFIGSVSNLRPWRTKRIIQKAHQLFEQ